MLTKVMAWGLGTVAMAGAVAFSEGSVQVRVVEKKPEGAHLRLIVPAMLVSLGLKFVPGKDLHEASQEIKPWVPAIQAAAAALENCPDGALVEVADAGEHVRVAKEGSALVVDVDDQEDTVHVSVPLGTLRRVARQLAEAGSPI